jgi:hypothetical protein
MVHLPYSASLQILYPTIQNAPAANCVPRGQRVKILGQSIDLLSMSRQSIEVAANVNYVPFIERKPEICVNLVSNL